VIGWFSGVMWANAGWAGLVWLLGATLVLAMMIALKLRGLVPLSP
jgi:YNFM family putative membrane transporter